MHVACRTQCTVTVPYYYIIISVFISYTPQKKSAFQLTVLSVNCCCCNITQYSFQTPFHTKKWMLDGGHWSRNVAEHQRLQMKKKTWGMQSTHYLSYKLNEMTQTMQLFDEMELRYRLADCKETFIGGALLNSSRLWYNVYFYFFICPSGSSQIQYPCSSLIHLKITIYQHDFPSERTIWYFFCCMPLITPVSHMANKGEVKYCTVHQMVNKAAEA